MIFTGRCKTSKLGYYGSVLNKNLFIRSLLESLLSNQNISFRVPSLKPEAGALIGAFHESGNPVTRTVITNSIKYH